MPCLGFGHGDRGSVCKAVARAEGECLEGAPRDERAGHRSTIGVSGPVIEISRYAADTAGRATGRAGDLAAARGDRAGRRLAYRQPSAGATWVRMLSMTWAL